MAGGCGAVGAGVGVIATGAGGGTTMGAVAVAVAATSAVGAGGAGTAGLNRGLSMDNLCTAPGVSKEAGGKPLGGVNPQLGPAGPLKRPDGAGSPATCAKGSPLSDASASAVPLAAAAAADGPALPSAGDPNAPGPAWAPGVTAGEVPDPAGDAGDPLAVLGLLGVPDALASLEEEEVAGLLGGVLLEAEGVLLPAGDEGVGEPALCSGR